jgi:hypothetical protein
MWKAARPRLHQAASKEKGRSPALGASPISALLTSRAAILRVGAGRLEGLAARCADLLPSAGVALVADAVVVPPLAPRAAEDMPAMLPQRGRGLEDHRPPTRITRALRVEVGQAVPPNALTHVLFEVLWRAPLAYWSAPARAECGVCGRKVDGLLRLQLAATLAARQRSALRCGDTV